MSDTFETISASTIQRYSERFKSLGDDVRTLGWGSVEQQRIRFAQLFRAVDIPGHSLLDIGCGFGDLKGFCEETGRPPKTYIGWDLNADLINAARSRHPSTQFRVFDLLTAPQVEPTAQIGVMLGLLNFNLKGRHDNVDYSKRMIHKAFQVVTEALVVDFLSTCKTPDYPEEDFVFYHDPGEMLAFALELTPNVTALHDYPPIPQKEFMLVLSK